MSLRAELAAEVQTRAGQRCEYCKMHQALQGASFHIEHVLPSSLGGPTKLENLAFACPSCNLHKSDQTEATDSLTGNQAPLFNPRRDEWDDHFCFQDYRIEGLTPVGRATVAALYFNSDRRLLIRKAEELFDLFPP